MADKVSFELVAPERLVLAQDVDMVVVPGSEGDFGVLPGHSLLISAVRPGILDVYEGDRVTARVFVAGGFAEATPERCTVLADEAVPIDEIDRAAAETQIKDLQEDIADAKNETERSRAEALLRVAEARLAAAQASRA